MYSLVGKNFLIEIERSIFQTFWKIHSCTKFLFIELDTCSSIQNLKSLSKNKKIGATMYFPEGLVDTPLFDKSG